jgi:hypothetical protein
MYPQQLARHVARGGVGAHAETPSRVRFCGIVHGLHRSHPSFWSQVESINYWPRARPRDIVGWAWLDVAGDTALVPMEERQFVAWERDNPAKHARYMPVGEVLANPLRYARRGRDGLADDDFASDLHPPPGEYCSISMGVADYM